MTDAFADDPVRIYVQEVCKVPPLTNEQEADLWQRVRARDAQSEFALKSLIEANLGLVVSIAERHRFNGVVHILDLIQEGNSALLRAVNTFIGSPSGGSSAHAAAYIEQAIAKAIADARVKE